MSDSVILAKRYHDISCGHRVEGQGGKCEHLHGHNYRIVFYVTADKDKPALDDVGRVLDFSVIKSKLCMWLEEHWDHKFLIGTTDPLATALRTIDPTVVLVPFNPTAENMAAYLVEVIAPLQLKGTGCVVQMCEVEETRKCSAMFSL